MLNTAACWFFLGSNIPVWKHILFCGRVIWRKKNGYDDIVSWKYQLLVVFIFLFLFWHVNKIEPDFDYFIWFCKCNLLTIGLVKFCLQSLPISYCHHPKTTFIVLHYLLELSYLSMPRDFFCQWRDGFLSFSKNTHVFPSLFFYEMNGYWSLWTLQVENKRRKR